MSIVSKTTSKLQSQVANSIAESTASQVDVKLKSNQTKMQLRNLFKNVDQDKKGLVKESAFFSLIALHGVELSNKHVEMCKKRFGNGGMIKYKEAIQEL